jgi:glutamate racemase
MRGKRANKSGGVGMTGNVERRKIPTIHADGFDDFFLVNGILRCTAFTLVKSAFERRAPEREPMFYMRVAIAGAAEAQLEVQRLLEQQADDGFRLMRGAAAH